MPITTLTGVDANPHDLCHAADAGRPLGANRSAGVPRASKPTGDAGDLRARHLQRPPDTLCAEFRGLTCGQNVVRQVTNTLPNRRRNDRNHCGTWDPGRGRYWDRTSGLCRVKAGRRVATTGFLAVIPCAVRVSVLTVSRCFALSSALLPTFCLLRRFAQPDPHPNPLTEHGI